MWLVNASTFTGRPSTCSLVHPHRSQHPVPQVISGPMKMSALCCETNESVLTQDTEEKPHKNNVYQGSVSHTDDIIW